MKPVGAVKRPEQIEFILRRHGLWDSQTLVLESTHPARLSQKTAAKRNLGKAP